MASRSTVNTPVALASAAAWLASGESRVLGGMDLGSEAMFMPHFTRGPAAVQPRKAASIEVAVGHNAVMGEVAEARELALEMDFHRAGGAVALLADDDFGLAFGTFHFGLPCRMFGRIRARLFVGEVIFLTIHEDDDVGVLFDRAGFTQVSQLRALVLAVF